MIELKTPIGLKKMRIISIALFYCASLLPHALGESKNPPVILLNPQNLSAPIASPIIQTQFPITSSTRKTNTLIDLSKFTNRPKEWNAGSEGVVRIDAKFSAEDAMLRLWLHYRVCVFVGDGVYEQPFEVSGTIPVGRKGLNAKNETLTKKLAEAIYPAFQKAAVHLSEK